MIVYYNHGFLKKSINLKINKMKTTVAIVIALFISLTVMGSAYNHIQQAKDTITATYEGVTEDGMYKFTDTKGNEVLFDEVSDNVEIDLYDDENIGIMFFITWKKEEIYMYDEEDEPTDETQIIKTITKLKEL